MARPIHTMNITAAWDGSSLDHTHALSISIVRDADGLTLEVDAPFYGDPTPPEGPPGPTDCLWEYEVVEVFFCGADGRYTEIELAPGGHHLVLQLNGVRNPTATGLALDFDAKISGTRWNGTARIGMHLLPEGPLRVNGYAIHGSGAERTYMSWIPLPGGEPDFHQPDVFRPLEV